MRRTTLGLGICGSLLVLVLTGCGGDHQPGVATAGATSAAATPSASASVDRKERLRQFAACMREHGIDMTDPDVNGGVLIKGDAPVDTAKLKAANQACLPLLPGGGVPPKFSPEQIEQLRTFARCLRSHGLDVPDPDPATGLIPLEELAKINRSSQEFKDAEAACRDLRPAFLPAPRNG
jgi:hypothetical protein